METMTPRVAAGGRVRAAVAKGQDKSANVKPDATDFTTVRILNVDGEDLSDFAKLLGQTASEVYHEHLAPIIRKLLREKIQERLKRLN